MKNNKILIASLATLLLVSGCAKKVSAAEAKKFVTENYSLEKAKEKYASVEVTEVVDVTKSEGFFEGLVEVGKEEETYEGTISVVDETDIVDEEGYSYTLNGKKLTMKYALGADDLKKMMELPDEAKVSGSVSVTAKVNEYGCPESYVAVFDLKLSFTTSGVKVEGSLKAKTTQTYKYTAK